jgi:hypothetical protein
MALSARERTRRYRERKRLSAVPSSISCACGCGLFPKQSRLFVLGHNNAGHKRSAQEAATRARNGIRKRPTRRYRKSAAAGYLHRERAERALGHPLPTGAVVHHADGSKSDHAPLVICQDAAYHALLHARMRIQAAGGNPNTDKICSDCREAKPLQTFTIDRDSRDGRCKYCRPCLHVRQAATRARLRLTAA